MNKPYSDCTVNDDNSLSEPLKDSSLFDFIIKSNYSYSREYCYGLCEQMIVAKTCNCINFYNMFRIPNYKICKTSDETMCGYKSMVRTMEPNFYIINCLDKCPLECFEQKYKFLETFSNYPTINDLTRMEDDNLISEKFKNYTDFKDYLSDNIVKMSIYYDSLSYLETSESQLLSDDTLMANLCGQIGLFLGLSFISLYDLICFNYAKCLFLKKYYKKKNNKKVGPMEIVAIDN